MAPPVLYLVRDGTLAGAFALEDGVRPETRGAVGRLHALGVGVAMITGDARQGADAVAAELGIDEVFAEVLPEDKQQHVRQLQEGGHRVAMVARAGVGIAIGAGTDVAIESAGVILASDDPRGVVGVIELSKASYRKMLQNLGWAVGYTSSPSRSRLASPRADRPHALARWRCAPNELVDDRRRPERAAPAATRPQTGRAQRLEPGVDPGTFQRELQCQFRPTKLTSKPPAYPSGVVLSPVTTVGPVRRT